MLRKTVHYYIHGRNGEYVLRDPMALGHESAGIIVSDFPGPRRRA